VAVDNAYVLHDSAVTAAAGAAAGAAAAAHAGAAAGTSSLHHHHLLCAKVNASGGQHLQQPARSAAKVLRLRHLLQGCRHSVADTPACHPRAKCCPVRC
jgi:hypothetical protein